MWIFFILIFILGGLHSAVNLTLLKRRKDIGIVILLLFVGVYLLFPAAIRVNIRMLDGLIRNPDMLSLVCTCQVIEALCVMLLALMLIKGHYEIKRRRRRAEIAALLPLPVFLGGIFVLQVYYFNSIDGQQFYFTAAIFTVMVSAGLGAAALMLRKLFIRWEWRLELKVMLSFFQMVLAMFLPLILAGVGTNATVFKINIFAVLVTLAVMLVPVILGFVFKKSYSEEAI